MAASKIVHFGVVRIYFKSLLVLIDGRVVSAGVIVGGSECLVGKNRKRVNLLGLSCFFNGFIPS